MFISSFEKRIGWKGDYFEPFCGMLGVGIHFAKAGRYMLANDKNTDLILLLDAIKNGWVPPKSCSKTKYEQYKNNTEHSKLRGFYGFACAYSGIFYAGYRVRYKSRNFFDTFRSSLIQMKPYMSNVIFRNVDYSDFEPRGMTIYCDPPYMGNKFRTHHFTEFDFDTFWNTVREWSKYNLVFVSEYMAPPDFRCVWQKKLKTSFGNTKRINRTEKLFIHDASQLRDQA